MNPVADILKCWLMNAFCMCGQLVSEPQLCEQGGKTCMLEALVPAVARKHPVYGVGCERELVVCQLRLPISGGQVCFLLSAVEGIPTCSPCLLRHDLTGMWCRYLPLNSAFKAGVTPALLRTLLANRQQCRSQDQLGMRQLYL